MCARARVCVCVCEHSALGTEVPALAPTLVAASLLSASTRGRQAPRRHAASRRPHPGRVALRWPQGDVGVCPPSGCRHTAKAATARTPTPQVVGGEAMSLKR